MNKFFYLQKYEDVYAEIQRAKELENDEYAFAIMSLTNAMNKLINKKLKVNKLIQMSLAEKMQLIGGSSISTVAKIFQDTTDKVCFRVTANKNAYLKIIEYFDVISRKIEFQEDAYCSEKKIMVNFPKGEMEESQIKEAHDKIENYINNQKPELAVYKLKQIAVESAVKIFQGLGYSIGLVSSLMGIDIDIDKFGKYLEEIQVIKKVIEYANHVQENSLKGTEIDLKIFENFDLLKKTMLCTVELSDEEKKKKEENKELIIRDKKRVKEIEENDPMQISEKQKEEIKFVDEKYNMILDSEAAKKLDKRELSILKKFFAADKHSFINPSVAVLSLQDMVKKEIDFSCDQNNKERLGYIARYKQLFGKEGNVNINLIFSKANRGLSDFNLTNKDYEEVRKEVISLLYELKVNPDIVGLLELGFNAKEEIKTPTYKMKDCINAIRTYDLEGIFYSQKLIKNIHERLDVRRGIAVFGDDSYQTEEEAKKLLSSNVDLQDYIKDEEIDNFAKILYLNKVFAGRELTENEINEIKECACALSNWSGEYIPRKNEEYKEQSVVKNRRYIEHKPKQEKKVTKQKPESVNKEIKFNKVNDIVVEKKNTKIAKKDIPMVKRKQLVKIKTEESVPQKGISTNADTLNTKICSQLSDEDKNLLSGIEKADNHAKINPSAASMLLYEAFLNKINNSYLRATGKERLTPKDIEIKKVIGRYLTLSKKDGRECIENIIKKCNINFVYFKTTDKGYMDLRRQLAEALKNINIDEEISKKLENPPKEEIVKETPETTFDGIVSDIYTHEDARKHYVQKYIHDFLYMLSEREDISALKDLHSLTLFELLKKVENSPKIKEFFDDSYGPFIQIIENHKDLINTKEYAKESEALILNCVDALEKWRKNRYIEQFIDKEHPVLNEKEDKATSKEKINEESIETFTVDNIAEDSLVVEELPVNIENTDESKNKDDVGAIFASALEAEKALTKSELTKMVRRLLRSESLTSEELDAIAVSEALEAIYGENNSEEINKLGENVNFNKVISIPDEVMEYRKLLEEWES